VLRSIRTEAPNATVVLMGYPRIFPTGSGSQDCFSLNAVFRNDVQDWANARAEDLDGIMESAAARAGVHFVSVLDTFAGHGACGPDGSYMNGPKWTSVR
jgi:hypothetical protein